MSNSYTGQHGKLKFAWVTVPPAVGIEQYLGEESWHERRRAAHTSSFLALELLVDKIDKTEPETRDLRCERLSEQSYHCLTQTRQLCSRSHTEDWACACLSNEPPEKASVGVDIELQQREMKPGLERFYAHPEDSISSLQPLEIWCLKEAVFKAVSSFLNFHALSKARLVLTDLKLTQTGPNQVIFHYKQFQGQAGILPEKLGPVGLCTAWALLCI